MSERNDRDWTANVPSREPDPSERASEAEGTGSEEDDCASTEPEERLERKRIVSSAMDALKREDLGLYIILQEFLLAGGYYRVTGSNDMKPVSPWGYWTKCAQRWHCSAPAVSKWTTKAIGRLREMIEVAAKEEGR